MTVLNPNISGRYKQHFKVNFSEHMQPIVHPWSRFSWKKISCHEKLSPWGCSKPICLSFFEDDDIFAGSPIEGATVVLDLPDVWLDPPDVDWVPCLDECLLRCLDDDFLTIAAKMKMKCVLDKIYDKISSCVNANLLWFGIMHLSFHFFYLKLKSYKDCNQMITYKAWISNVPIHSLKRVHNSGLKLSWPLDNRLLQFRKWKYIFDSGCWEQFTR